MSYWWNVLKCLSCSQIFVYLAGGEVFECFFLVVGWILKSGLVFHTNSDLPVDHWRNRSEGRGKGKRPPSQSASRHPQKYARSDDRDHPSSRTAPSNELVIPRPPNASGVREPALQSKTSSRPKLTLGEAGIPPYQGGEYQPLTRKECKILLLNP